MSAPAVSALLQLACRAHAQDWAPRRNAAIAPQVAYRETALRQATGFPDRKSDLDQHFWSNSYRGAAQFRKFPG